MHDRRDAKSFEACVRKTWQRLIAEDLPCAAQRFGWPLHSPADFERVLLDQVGAADGEPGRERPCTIDLILAIELAERALQGQVCLTTLNRRSRALRGVDPCADRPPRRKT